MLHPRAHAAHRADTPAVIMAESGDVLGYGALERGANRAAHLYRSLDLVPGDAVAIFLENHLRYFEIVWGAEQAGLYYVAISSRLTAPEVDHILADSGAKLIVTSPALMPVAARIGPHADVHRFVLGAPDRGWASWDDVVAAMPSTPIADERAGIDMLYSSGTTGRPKGVRPALPDDPTIGAPNAMTGLLAHFGVGPDTIYPSPAPLYHAAPLRWSMTVQRYGGIVIVMEKFDPVAALALIERHRVTHSQWVPTHFMRMLKLPETDRRAHDLSSLRVAVHAAAPCPVPVKQAMIDWWGPILVEYYAGTEGNGATMIDSAAWLAHPGSVGRAVIGTPHICDDDGRELAPGEEGLVYFEGGPAFEYHNDPGKTASARDHRGWTTLGDIGRLDGDGYLYLTDRRSFMIISGGVNIYPQEIENLLVTHPEVMDAAVIGVPDDDLGERVVAVVQPLEPAAAGADLAARIGAWLRPSLSGVKMPRRMAFLDELPRAPTGKLYKRSLIDMAGSLNFHIV